MTETLTLEETPGFVPEEAQMQTGTPPIRLAYEGLMRLVDSGRITYEDALVQHRSMFPHEE